MSNDTTDAATPEQWVGARFRSLRKERGWSQEDLAKLMRAFGYKWSQATVTRLEAATRPVRLNEVTDLAALYSVKLADLVAELPERHLACSTCGDGPPPGFTCNTCGRSGT